jgi:hypothetical protein
MDGDYLLFLLYKRHYGMWNYVGEKETVSILTGDYTVRSIRWNLPKYLPMYFTFTEQALLNSIRAVVGVDRISHRALVKGSASQSRVEDSRRNKRGNREPRRTPRQAEIENPGG